MFTFFQVNLIFPIIYVLCSIFVTLVPMIASPVETGLVVVRFVSHSILLGIGCAIIFTGVPVYFIIVSDDYVKKPESVRRFLGEEDLEKPSVYFHPFFSMMRSFPFLSTCVPLIPLISPNPAASETIWLQKLFLAVATDKTD